MFGNRSPGFCTRGRTRKQTVPGAEPGPFTVHFYAQRIPRVNSIAGRMLPFGVGFGPVVKLIAEGNGNGFVVVGFVTKQFGYAVKFGLIRNVTGLNTSAVRHAIGQFSPG